MKIIILYKKNCWYFFLLIKLYQETRKVLTMLGYLNQPLPDPRRQTYTALVTAKSTGWVVI